MNTQEFPKLTGKELINKTNQLKHLNISEVARQCGYYRRNDKGQVRIELKKYHEARMLATGLKTAPNQDKTSKKKLAPVSMQKSGNIIIGASHTKGSDFPIGTKWEVKVTSKKITLVKIDGNS